MEGGRFQKQEGEGTTDYCKEHKKEKNWRRITRSTALIDLWWDGKFDKAPLICLKMTLFTDDIYRKKVPEEYRGQIFLHMVTKYDCNLK